MDSGNTIDEDLGEVSMSPFLLDGVRRLAPSGSGRIMVMEQAGSVLCLVFGAWCLNRVGHQ